MSLWARQTDGGPGRRTAQPGQHVRSPWLDLLEGDLEPELGRTSPLHVLRDLAFACAAGDEPRRDRVDAHQRLEQFDGLFAGDGHGMFSSWLSVNRWGFEKWHATVWSVDIGVSGGSSVRHRSGWPSARCSGQRGANRHPGAIAVAFGGSPVSSVRGPRRARPSCRHHLDERAGVRMQRVADHVGGGAFFDDLAQVEHGDPIGEDASQCQVVGDEKCCDAESFA